MNSPWKGKAKAANPDYDDLRPTITYRQILSNNLGVRDPLRIVALCDSDAFYAACERVRLGLDPSVPIVVQQWESLIAVSYPAREFGISRMDKLKDAKKKCPNLLAVHVATYKEGEKEPGYWDDVDTRTHKVSLDLYRRESNKIIGMFKEALPTGEVEKASIDEAFIDFTRPVREKLLERYPYLAHVPADAPDGTDSPLPPPPPINWDGLGSVVPVSPSGETDGASEHSDEVDGGTTWHDVALSIAAELMGKIREDIHSKLGYTTSAGISRNKFLAKLSASYKKPDSQTILRNDAIPNYLRPLAFQKIRFLGGKLGDALAKEYDVSTVGDLLTVSLDEMQSKFGESALWVYELLRGIDRNEVKEKSALFKSMLASKNLPKPITQSSDGHQWIRVLAAELALRLNDARESMPTLWPKTIVLHARKGYETSRSKQATFPFVQPVTVDVIATAADKLWKELTGDAKIIHVTSVQLAFTGLEKAEMGQKSIEGFFKARDTQKPTSLKRRREEDVLSGSGEDSNAAFKLSDAEAVSFQCPRCLEVISLQEDQVTGDSAEVARRLAALRLEHNDFHFAQDLAHSNDAPVPHPRNSSSRGGTRRKVEPKGIAKFFTKK
ncbi:DNA/RNA polymerase [Rhizopogon salebrosus TDB-379]|nr:DNA/RNA polymerase [Rhizopogon salebrosus TDB-379]